MEKLVLCFNFLLPLKCVLDTMFCKCVYGTKLKENVEMLTVLGWCVLMKSLQNLEEVRNFRKNQKGTEKYRKVQKSTGKYRKY